MKKNRKIPKRMSVIAGTTMHFAAIIVILFVMVILNLLASSSCTQLKKSIGEKERICASLDKDLQRESTRWQEMTTPDKLEMALLRHGLAMRTPRSEQWVRMRPDGRPYPTQRSVAIAKARGATLPTASYKKDRKRIVR